MSQTAEVVQSPVAGKVIEVSVAEGDAVAEGATVVLLESMKMEVPTEAPHDGRVSRLHVSEGSVVAEGDDLFVVTPL